MTKVPWRAVAGLRNFYAHAYEGIDGERMREDIRRGDITQLAEQLAAILRKLRDDRSHLAATE